MAIRSVVVLAVLSFAPAAHALDITTCGQVVPRGETGVLVADLTCGAPTLGCYACSNEGNCFPTGAACATADDCAPTDDGCHALPGVAIDRHARFDMNGHALSAPGTVAVACRSKGPCTVTSSSGRGDISGSSLGIIMRTGKLAVSNVDVHDNEHGGIYSPLLAVRVTLSSVTVNDNGGEGVRASDVDATDVTASGNGRTGIIAEPGKFKGTNVTASDNGYGGIWVGHGIKATNVVATGNGFAGVNSAGGGVVVRGGGVKLAGSTVTGNTYTVGGQGPLPLDFITGQKPKLTGTTCDHSIRIDRQSGGLGATWGVCAGD